MTEETLQYISFFKVIFAAFVGLFYGLGGIKNKWKRRYMSSFIILFGVSLFGVIQGNFSFWFLLCYPGYIIAFSVGYGSEDVRDKLVKRTRYGALVACASLPLAVVHSSWVLWIFHLALMVFISNSLGIFNPIKARSEETIIGTLSCFLPFFM